MIKKKNISFEDFVKQITEHIYLVLESPEYKKILSLINNKKAITNILKDRLGDDFFKYLYGEENALLNFCNKIHK